MATQLQIKRSTVTGRAPNTTSSGNTTYIAAGELAINLTDGKLFSSNGSALITVGSNLDSLSVNSISLTGRITANSSNGTAGQVLASGGSGNVYWATVAGGGGGGSNVELTANTTDTQSFFFPMSNTTSGAWTNAVVDSTDLSYIPSSGLLTLASANVTSTLNVVGGATVNGALVVNNTAATGNTTITGFVNVSSYGTFGGQVNATSFNSTGTSTSTFANNVTITGVANAVTLNITGSTVSNFASNVAVTGFITATSGFGTRIVTIADGASVTINADTTDVAIQTNTQAVGTLTINAPTGTLANGQKVVFRLQSTNVQTFAWNGVFVGSNDLSLPSASTGSSKYDYVGFIYNTTASKWQLLAKNFGF